MVAERGEFLSENQGNKSNGFRPGHTYGRSRRLEFRIPRDRYGNFHPQILALLRGPGGGLRTPCGEPLHKGAYTGAGL